MLSTQKKVLCSNYTKLILRSDDDDDDDDNDNDKSKQYSTFQCKAKAIVDCFLYGSLALFLLSGT